MNERSFTLQKKLLIIHSGDLYSASSRDYYSEAIIMTDCPKSLLPLATSRQEVFLNCMNVKHLCSSQEEVDARLFLHSLDSVRKGPTKLYIQAHISSQVEKTRSKKYHWDWWYRHLVSQELQHCPAFCMTL